MRKMYLFNFYYLKTSPPILKEEKVPFFIKQKLAKAIVALLILFSFIPKPGLSQTANENKIHPLFRRLLTEEKAVDAANKKNGVPADQIKKTAVQLKGVAPSYSLKATAVVSPKNGVTEIYYDCIVRTTNGQALRDSGFIVNSILPTFVTASVTAAQIVRLSEIPEVTYIDVPRTRATNNDIARANTGANLLGAGMLNNTKYTGKGVIVGVFDTGIDWDLLDFRDPTDPTKSRILRIWDQTLTAIPGEAAPTGFSYGVEYTQTQLNDELDGTPTNYVRERDIDGHGTHVAGTAAGNGAALVSRQYMGMAPEADIVVIKGGNGSFSSSNIVDGMTYLKNLATTLGEPVVLNMSLGGQYAAHDGTGDEETAVNSFTGSANGRVVAIAAGNDNGTLIHRQVDLTANGSNGIVVAVPSTTTATDLFEFLTYSSSNGSASVTLTAPNGQSVVLPANQSLNGVGIMNDSFQVYGNNFVDGANNNRYFDIYVARSTVATGNGNINKVNPVGNWTMTFTDASSAATKYDGWLAYKNSTIAVTVTSGDNNQLVGSPGDATSAITVGAFTGKYSWYSKDLNGGLSYTSLEQDSIASFSSHGPRRDGVLKPEITANGAAVISCLSSDATPPSGNLVVTGLYMVDQGTSMSTPVVAGCAALLLQASPTASYTAIKAAIASTATTDAFTQVQGATPNTTWGYGRLDVFKAAATLFGTCTSVTRTTYQYDLSSGKSGFSLADARVAVKLTPTISGKLSGLYYDPYTQTTSTLVEIRTSVSGAPGALLGTLTVDSANISAFSINYVDLTPLNIPVVAGTDYFAVLARAVGKTTAWTLVANAATAGNLTYYSTNGGSTWGQIGYNFRIRPIVYSTTQTTSTIATTTSSETRTINSSNQFMNASCQLIANVLPTGTTNALTGTVTSKVTIETAPIHAGSGYFVQRHYDVIPTTNAANATATVTLYFTQAEFDNFNNTAGHGLNAPTSPGDATGISNIRIAQYHGTSATSLPNDYPGPVALIDPTDANIVWNATNSRWEVGFAVAGFSGFFLQTSSTVLPIRLEYFVGNKNGPTNVLTWKLNCTGPASKIVIERATDAVNFSGIGTMQATETACISPFAFTDASPAAGKDFYRLKMIDASGEVAYSNIILLVTGNAIVNNLYPTIIDRYGSVTVSFSGLRGTIDISDASGRRVYTAKVAQGVQGIYLPLKAAGTYFYSLTDGNDNVSQGKIVVR